MLTTPATILIVDDVAANRYMLACMVQAQGHHAVGAASGRAALELMQAQPFDMVLLDILMPDMNGYEVLTELKDHPTLQHVPVVVISVIQDSESITRCIALGAADYLFNPVDRTLLGARIDACLVRKRIHDREQAAYEAVWNANRAKTEFVSLISHELKNPLTAIRGYTDMLTQGTFGPIDDEQAQCITVIRELADHMATLLSDLSDLSRIETGQLRLEYAVTPLAGAVAIAVRSVKRAIVEKQQQLNLTLAHDLPALWADQVRVVQILTNLLSNACKYTPIGGSITLRAYESSSGMITIAIADTGIGISSENQHHMFEQFFRADDSAVRQERGTGLGLHITRLLVESHGGQIWFESTLHEGTTFYVTLPSAEQSLAVGTFEANV